MQDDDTIVDTKSLGTNHFTLRANLREDADTVRSVKFQWIDRGDEKPSSVDRLAPHAVFGNSLFGGYSGEIFEVGEHTITATPYAELFPTEDSIMLSEPFSITFTVD